MDTAGPSSEDVLARTGAQTARPLVGGVAVLMLGGLALMFIRRGNHA
ncbi:LPXTG cell wall anchor domain-containing protein [Arthrobacter sp. TWP1-1]